MRKRRDSRLRMISKAIKLQLLVLLRMLRAKMPRIKMALSLQQMKSQLSMTKSKKRRTHQSQTSTSMTLCSCFKNSTKREKKS